MKRKIFFLLLIFISVAGYSQWWSTSTYNALRLRLTEPPAYPEEGIMYMSRTDSALLIYHAGTWEKLDPRSFFSSLSEAYGPQFLFYNKTTGVVTYADTAGFGGSGGGIVYDTTYLYTVKLKQMEDSTIWLYDSIRIHKDTLEKLRIDLNALSSFTQEEIEDFVGGMVSGNTETGIAVTYEDADGTFDFILGDLSGTYQTVLTNEAGLYAALSDVTQFLETGDNATLLNGTSWRLLYINGSGDVTELTLGADGTFLESNGASAIPGFRTLQAGDIPDISGTYSTQAELAALEALINNNTAGIDTLTSEANILYVPAGADIQTFIAFADSGYTVVLGSGLYTITDTIEIDKPLNIRGQGRSGFVTTPVSPTQGTLIGSSIADMVAFKISSDNVCISDLSINLTGADSKAILTVNNRVGIVFNDLDIIVNSSGALTALYLLGSNVVMRDVTFKVTSSNGVVQGAFVSNNSSTTQDIVVDAYNVTGTAIGGATHAFSFAAYNNNDANTITLNLSNSICRGESGTPLDVGVASTSVTTNNSIVNCEFCTIDGDDYDFYQTGTNVLNVAGSLLKNGTSLGTIIYRSTMASERLSISDSAFVDTLVVNSLNSALIIADSADIQGGLRADSAHIEGQLHVGDASTVITGTGVTISGNEITGTDAGHLNTINRDLKTALDSLIYGYYSLLLTDVKNLFVFGFGGGSVGDTIYAVDSLGVLCGHYYINEDSVEITKILTNLPDGDTIVISYVYNDSLGVTADCDTIVTIEAGDYETETITFDISTISENNYIWVEIDAVVMGRKPIWFRSDMLGRIKRD